MKIVNAEEKHIPAIRDIYAHHVLHGTGSFETDPPDAHQMFARLEKSAASGCRGSSRYRKIRSFGYCYLTPLSRARRAYRYTLEDSIYIAPTAQRQGVGKALLCHVIGWAEAQGYRLLIAIVGDSNNQGSLKVHQPIRICNRHAENIGFKHGLWLDTVLLQRNLGEGNSTLPPDFGVAI